PVPCVTSSLTTPRPPRSPLLPYTTLFRSLRFLHEADRFRSLGHVILSGHRSRKREGHGGPDRQQRSGHRSAADYQAGRSRRRSRSEEHTSELQSRDNLVCQLLLEKKKCEA